MRDKAISDARAFGDYQLECVQKQYELDSDAVEEEYQVLCCMGRHGLPFMRFKLISFLFNLQFEKQNLHDMMMAAIAEKKKQIVEDRDDIGERSSGKLILSPIPSIKVVLYGN